MGFEMKQVTGHGPVTHYRLCGELDLSVSGGVADELREAREDAAGGLVIDLAEVTFIDSSGLRALLLAASNGHPDLPPVVLATPSTAVSEIFALTGVDRLLNLVDDVAAYEWPNLN